MKKLLLALGIMALMCSPALAGRNAGGAMLLHVNNALTYTATDYCDNAQFPLPQTCDGLVTDITRDPNVEAIIWMVGAFNDASSPGVNAYSVGLSGDINSIDYFTAFAPCGPGFFEIADPTWPVSGSGTAVAYSSTVNSHLFKMYWFAVYAPGAGASINTTNYFVGDHHAEWVDDSNPPATDFCNLFGTVTWGGPGAKNCPPNGPVVGACCLPDGSCQDVASDVCGSLGGIYHGDGTNCATTQCPQPTGACCAANGTCTVTTLVDCTGAWQGPGTNCDPNNCPQPEGACCFNDGSCQNLTQTACTAQGGTWHSEGTCDTVTCLQPPTGACCIGQDCTITTETGCTGTWKGAGTTCDPVNPCIPVPTKSTTWGQIKGQYR